MTSKADRKLQMRRYGQSALPPVQAPKFEKYVPPVSQPPRAGSLDYKKVPSMEFGRRV